MTYQVRSDLSDAQDQAWRRLGQPGALLDGAQRVAAAAEVRKAWESELSLKRKAALSPYAVDGEHAPVEGLSALQVDFIHRLSTDPGRLDQDWVTATAAEMTVEVYIELVSIVAIVSVQDAFSRAVGEDLKALPDPVAGEPTGYKAPGAKMHDAWLPYVAPEDQVPSDEPMYGDEGYVAVVVKALSPVPDAWRHYWDFVDVHYLPNLEVYNLETNIRAISRPQIEVIAARVSAMHQCLF